MSEHPRPTGDARRAVPVLRVGHVPGVTVTKWRRVWAERFPSLPLEVVEIAQPEQRDALEQEQVDMCFVRLPLPDDRLHVIPLYEEVPVVVVPKDHPVSLYDEVSLGDLSGEYTLEGFDTGEVMDLVAGGAGITFVPHSIARSHSRRDLVYRPVSDGTPTRIALAWLRENPHEMIEDFIGIVRGRTVNSSRSARPEPDAGRAATSRKPRPAADGSKSGHRGRGGPAKRAGRPRGR